MTTTNTLYAAITDEFPGAYKRQAKAPDGSPFFQVFLPTGETAGITEGAAERGCKSTEAMAGVLAAVRGDLEMETKHKPSEMLALSAVALQGYERRGYFDEDRGERVPFATWEAGTNVRIG